MEEEDDIHGGDPDSVLGRVRDIRRKWAVQEDEALAYRLQDEEIAQHYNSNRTRNAIVREDAPRAREAQRQEDLQALEERLQHLSVLQKQAEEDARLAKLLASRDTESSRVKRHPQSLYGSNGRPENEKIPHSPKKPSPPATSLTTLQHGTEEVITTVPILKKAKSPLLGAAATDAPGPSRSCLVSPTHSTGLDEIFNVEDLRKIQEEKDAEMARALQEELDRTERDKLMAVEAQDRELAKMIHDKEKSRLRRAKEKARLKAEAMAAERGESLDGGEGVRVASRNSACSDGPRSTDLMPPKIPEKQKSPTSDHIGFRANPKPLPPHPQTHEFSSFGVPSQHRLEHHRLPIDPVPPYMPIHGYNSPKRNK